MLVTPLPGVDRGYLLDKLREVQTDVGNLYGGGPHGYYERLLAYLEWVTNAVERLSGAISSADLDRLVLTKRYEHLLAGVGSLASKETERLTNLLVSLELRQRSEAFTTAVETLKRQIELWSRSGRFVVLDSSFFIRHDEKFDEANFGKLLQVWEDPIHIILPMVVVDELDNLKQHHDKHVRWRAAYSVAVLDKKLQGASPQTQLRPEDFSGLGKGEIPRGEVTMEILFDPPRHVRLPINDDEIIDRTVSIQPLTGRQVTLITYDTGQASRGRNAGLGVVKLAQPIEPPTGTDAQGKPKK